MGELRTAAKLDLVVKHLASIDAFLRVLVWAEMQKQVKAIKEAKPEPVSKQAPSGPR